MVFIVGDGAQRIYRRDVTWKELGLGIGSHNSYMLTRSYRSTREIVDVALHMIKDSRTIVQDMVEAGEHLLELDKQNTHFRHGDLPFILSFKTSAVEYAEVAKEIRSLLKKGYRSQDIIILQRHRWHNRTLADELTKQGVACRVIQSRGQINLNEATVKIITLHSAKGLEFKVVFICGLEDFSVDKSVQMDSDEFQRELDQERKLLYVGMTRARDLLYITYSGVAPEWIVSRLTQQL